MDVSRTQRQETEAPPPPHARLAVDALDYPLPSERIATHPAEPRDSARMLVVWRSDSTRIEHCFVRDLPGFLQAGDALVFNDTAVAPARLQMRRSTGARIEGLFLAEADRGVAGPGLLWQIMLRSSGRIVAGERLTLLDPRDQPTNLSLQVLEHDCERWLAALGGETSTMAALDRIGRTPLPPYIVKTRAAAREAHGDDEDRRWYQTVYANLQKRQSVAAPTAGLHFTPELLQTLAAAGVRRIDVTLHVGPGTFKPITAATIDAHPMHSERFEVSAAALRALREVRTGNGADESSRAKRGRIIAVGTTSVRALESLPDGALEPDAQICGPIRESTDLLIAPPHEFRHLDGLLTNFHLPRSTLLALVAAMLGLPRLHELYREAMACGYRFYSYGDAMLILP